MRDIWLVLKHEYMRHVARKGFIFALLSVPLILVVSIGAGFLSVAASMDPKPAAYVDLAGVIQVIPPAAAPSLDSENPFSNVELLPYATEAEARAALDAKEIQAYYVIEADYLETGAVRLVAVDRPNEGLSGQLADILQYNLLSRFPPEVQKRVMNGPVVEVLAMDGSQQMSGANIWGIMLPLGIGLLFFFGISYSSGYLMSALIEEKENRTVEILLTSISPNHLMAGKVAGNLLAGLTPLLVWGGSAGIGLIILMTSLPESARPDVDPNLIWISLLAFIPAFLMIAALMAAVGSSAASESEANQYSGLFTLPLVVPLWFMMLLIDKPNSPLSVGLSLFPFTAPIALTMRASFTTVPFWQIALSIGLLWLTALACMWFAGRTFRLGMLNYGKRLKLKEVFRRSKPTPKLEGGHE